MRRFFRRSANGIYYVHFRDLRPGWTKGTPNGEIRSAPLLPEVRRALLASNRRASILLARTDISSLGDIRTDLWT